MCKARFFYEPHCNGSGDKRKYPYPLRNCVIPNSATAGGGGTIVAELETMHFFSEYGFLL